MRICLFQSKIAKLASMDMTEWKCFVILGLVLINYHVGMSKAEDKNTEQLADHNVTLVITDIVEMKQGAVKQPVKDWGDPLYRKNQLANTPTYLRPNVKEVFMSMQTRVKRELQNIATETHTKTEDGDENLPVPEKQSMNTQPIMRKEAWVKPAQMHLEFQSKKVKEEIDSDAEESILIQEGIKSRAPKVNFITQQRKSGFTPSDTLERTNDKLIQELYKKPQRSLNYEHPWTYDSFMATSQSPMYPQIHNKYDSFHRDMINRMHPPAPHHFDHYYERRHDVEYDSYFPRYKFPYYYYYPDMRYDVPLHYRDRNNLYPTEQLTRAIPSYNRPLPTTVVPPTMRNRRIIYFATLPEIVRKHPKENIMNDRLYQGDRYSTYTMKYFYPSSAYKYPRPAKKANKDDKYVSSKPIKIVREADVIENRQSSIRDLQKINLELQPKTSANFRG